MNWTFVLNSVSLVMWASAGLAAARHFWGAAILLGLAGAFWWKAGDTLRRVRERRAEARRDVVSAKILKGYEDMAKQPYGPECLPIPTNGLGIVQSISPAGEIEGDFNPWNTVQN
ncbi:MAG: hypothetical protein K8T91_12975 [Planctomycetes bacterium]|nr:hypothetical protein [Planctomycetota bacterium]